MSHYEQDRSKVFERDCGKYRLCRIRNWFVLPWEEKKNAYLCGVRVSTVYWFPKVCHILWIHRTDSAVVTKKNDLYFYSILSGTVFFFCPSHVQWPNLLYRFFFPTVGKKDPKKFLHFIYVLKESMQQLIGLWQIY